MNTRSVSRIVAIFALLMSMLSVLMPVSAGAQESAPGGLTDETSYESPQFGYTVTWDEPWGARARNITSNEGGFDALTLRNGSSSLRVTGRAEGEDPATVLEDAISLEIGNVSEAEVVVKDPDADPRTAQLTIRNDTVRIEVHELPANGATVVIVLSARTADYDDVLASAQEIVTLNGSMILTGKPLGSNTPVAGEDETPEVVAEPTNTDEEETSTPSEPIASGLDGSSYISPNFGYGFSWDDTVWETSADSEISTTDPVYDSLRLDAETGVLYIYAYEAYDGDASACLQGESDFYESDDPGVTDWTIASDANGDPITSEDDTSAWGVFTLTYQDQDDETVEPVQLTDYIECRTLVPGESILIIFSTSPRAVYNDHIDSVQSVIDTLEPGDATPADPTATATATDEPVETPDATETPETIETPDATVTPRVTKPATPVALGDVPGLVGSVFTSPSFDFVFTIPTDFSLQSATIETGDETLTLSNGTSVVSVHATEDPAFAGTLPSCVEAVAGVAEADPAYAGFKIDRTSEGDIFQGSDDRSAYANYTYTNVDGDKQAYFIECRSIDEGASVLIVTQDVAYDQYTAERGARREVQNSIDLP